MDSQEIIKALLPFLIYMYVETYDARECFNKLDNFLPYHF